MTAKDGQVFQAAGSVITGDVTIGRDCGVWYNAVIRGDEVDIHIGDRTNIQDNAVVHGDPGNPVHIGSGVTIGHGAIVHGCSIGDNSLIGMGAIILNGARIGRDCIIGAGALVTQGTEIPDGSVAFGNPARIRGQMSPEAVAENRRNADSGIHKQHLFVIGPVVENHKAPVDLLQDQDPGHQMGKGQRGQFPADIRPGCQGRCRSQGTRDHENQTAARSLPAAQPGGKILTGPFLSVQVQQDHEIIGPDPGKSPFRLLLHGDAYLGLPLRMQVGLILHFADLDLTEGRDPLAVFLIQGGHGFILEPSDRKQCNHAQRSFFLNHEPLSLTPGPFVNRQV